MIGKRVVKPLCAFRWVFQGLQINGGFVVFVSKAKNKAYKKEHVIIKLIST